MKIKSAKTLEIIAGVILVVFLIIKLLSSSNQSSTSSSFSGYKITSPKEDAAYCMQLLDQCHSVADVKKAGEKINGIIMTYNNAFENGDITGPQYKEFLMNAPNQTEIENKLAYFQNFGSD